MARIKVEDVVDHLDTEFRRALEETIKEHFPRQDFDAWAIFRTFKRQVYRKCSTWEEVPDDYIEFD
ncbi:hypothetical protein [Pontibacter cellulosilyticus]|uniref:Uncharacterized protein n=1 Tax=Pontibacter cellulosilyticus TaxID=1720253 RepID=A0A923N894_9BACT|nr:hypothetical protein [Pontibacter cellulosilyticus]MBC5994023.1 hypothetical protein [Pontibacter cellulosilyticus]